MSVKNLCKQKPKRNKNIHKMDRIFTFNQNFNEAKVIT